MSSVVVQSYLHEVTIAFAGVWADYVTPIVGAGVAVFILFALVKKVASWV